MKTVRLCYIKWRGNDCVATLNQTKSIPISNIEYCIQTVSYSVTGVEYRGCICTDNPIVNLGFVVGSVKPQKLSLEHIKVPSTARKTVKKIKRDEISQLVKNLLESEYINQVQQQTLF